MSNAARTAYDLAFQVSPIILAGGIVQGVPGGLVPIIALYGQAAGFLQGALSTGVISDDDFYYKFLPLPGSTAIQQTIGQYPFANQLVAANATVQQPLTVSLRMLAPVNRAGGYLTKLAIFSALQQSLLLHNAAGGSYHIATPSLIYMNCLMTGLTDITQGETAQQQVEWQFDFVQPLISKSQALAAMSAFMKRQASGGVLTSSSPSAVTAGEPAQSGALNGLTGGIINALSGGVSL